MGIVEMELELKIHMGKNGIFITSQEGIFKTPSFAVL
jgi:hypothetical protein